MNDIKNGTLRLLDEHQDDRGYIISIAVENEFYHLKKSSRNCNGSYNFLSVNTEDDRLFYYDLEVKTEFFFQEIIEDIVKALREKNDDNSVNK